MLGLLLANVYYFVSQGQSFVKQVLVLVLLEPKLGFRHDGYGKRKVV